MKVDAYNASDVIIYTGSTAVYVVSGTVTPVYLNLNPSTGNIYITVTWGEPEREWGKTVNGIRISINLDDHDLKPYDQAYSNILIQNMNEDSSSFEAYVAFCLYDANGFLRYCAYIDMESSDYFHTKSVISFEESNLINRTFEITGLSWVSSVSSRPPDTDFYNLVQSDQYTLGLQIEPVSDTFPIQFIFSNQVLVDIQSTESERIIYYNSFESATDTAGFEGYGYYDFNNESSPDVGNHSLYVSGGCLWPHVIVKIPEQKTDGHYQLKGWGRDLEIGGIVELHNNWPTRGESIHFSVSDSVWLFYTSDSILYCPAGQPMTLMMGAGGIAPSAMLVDEIEIVKLD